MSCQNYSTENFVNKSNLKGIGAGGGEINLVALLHGINNYSSFHKNFVDIIGSPFLCHSSK